MENFSESLKRIRDIALIYRNELDNIPGLTLLNYKEDRKSSFWLFTILVENRLRFIKKMKDSDVPVSVVHQRIDRFSVFGKKSLKLLNQERFDENQIAIPIHSELNEEDIETIIQSIKKGW